MSAADLRDYKEGYRDGLRVGENIAQVVAKDGGTADEAAELIGVLASSHVLDNPEPRD